MELLNEYSGLFSLIAAIASVVAIIVAIRISKQSSKQIDEIYKDWDKKRKFSYDYNPQAELWNNVKKE